MNGIKLTRVLGLVVVGTALGIACTNETTVDITALGIGSLGAVDGRRLFPDVLHRLAAH